MQSSTCTVTITGNISASTATLGQSSIYLSGGVLSMTGNVTGGAGDSCTGINVASGLPTATIIGNVTGGGGGTSGTADGVRVAVGSTTVAGTVTGGAKGAGIGMTGGTVYLSGMLDETGGASSLNKRGGGTFNWTPPALSTYTRGGFVWHNPDRFTDPGAANVATGSNYVYNAVAQSAGYPTTAATQAANAATLEAQKAKLLAPTNIAFGASSVTGTLPVAKVMAANGGDILTTDVRSDTVTGAAAGGTLDVAADNTSDGGGIGIGI
jgi:hypothetical protein